MKKILICMLMNLLITGGALAEVFKVVASQMRFTPSEIQIQAGDTVEWVNEDRRGYHTIFFNQSQMALESPPLFPGEVWPFTFENGGEYQYRCGPHPDMLGKVRVIGAEFQN